ncbi:MAG: RHS repeat protein [Mariniphaga sp.]|nr:RHS repeat protein [Mariniphaga sp.]
MTKVATFLLSMTFTLIGQNSHGQSSSFAPKDFMKTPPSPNAAQLGSFGAAEVGLFTGTAQYSIPLYTFESSNLSLPISLNYSSNGLKVDELTSWAGLNWVLSAGGVISRYRKGTVDKPGGRTPVPNWNNMTAEQKYDFCFNASSLGGIGNEPDIFSYSLPNYSGKFAFDDSGKPVLFPYANLKIETNPPTSNSYTFFNITTPDGIIYKYSDSEQTGQPSESTYPSSWYLSEIIHPKGDSITFHYDGAWITQYLATAQNVSVVVELTGSGGGTPPPENIEKVIKCTNYVLFLKEVDFHKYGKIIFEKSADRSDADGEYKLNKIVIKDSNGTQVKAFSFWYQFPYRNNSYQANANATIGDFDMLTGKNNYRMFLDSLQQLDATNTRISSYKFNYNSLDGLPARFSYSQDHWGYFNGKFNEDLAPFSAVPTMNRNAFSNMVTSYANRNADYNFSKRGMLNKITFPTGGYTTIDYEAHKGSTGKEIGGCRVLRTTSYASPSATPQIKKYIYPYLESAIDTIYYQTYKAYYNVSCGPSCQSSGSYTVGVLSSNSLYGVYIDGKYHVVYPTIEVDDGENKENGKTVYDFDYSWDSPGTPLNGQPVYPLAKSNSGFDSGLKTDSEISDNSNTVKKKETITYNKAEMGNYKVIHCMAVNARPQDNNVFMTNAERLQYYDVVPYDIISKWYYINSVVQTDYQSNGSILQKTTGYSYNNPVHAQISLESTTNSLGETLTKKYLYPLDYSPTANSNSCESTRLTCIASATTTYNQMIAQCNAIPDTSARATCINSYTSAYNYNVTQCNNTYNSCMDASSSDQSIISEMQNKYIISPVIEEQNLLVKNNVTTLTGGKIHKYKKQNGLIVNGKEFAIELSTPSTDLTASSFNASQVMTFHPAYKEKLTYDNYDTNGNIIQYHLSDNTNTSFLWAYNATKPVIQGVNVSYDVLKAAVENAVGTTNLETYWNGFNSIATNSTQQATWKTFNTNLRNNASLANAQITAYTYDPLIGMTSQTDPNGITTYYEYDSFGRLKLTKDQYGNIIKIYNYHYQEQ